MGGAALAVAGLAVLMLSDRRRSAGRSAGRNPLLGDGLVLIGATGYAMSNVLTEHVLERAKPTELLAGLGGFGFIWSMVNVAVFERHALAQASWGAREVGVIALYTAMLFGFYYGAMLLLQRGGSVVR
jgi:solute carrier family 35, member F1/2